MRVFITRRVISRLVGRTVARICAIGGIAAAAAGPMAPTMVAAQTQGQRQGQERVVQQTDRTVYKRKTVIDFSDVTIQGELTKPEGSYLLNRKKTKFKTLLQIRADFLQELFNSTDNL